MTGPMTSEHWPFAGLRLTTPRLELRLASYDDLDALAVLASEGIHPPEEMPFSVPWTDAPPAERARATMQWHWRCWAALTVDDWQLPFVVVVVDDGCVVGVQELSASAFAVRREVATGSWLGLAHQGRGIGTEMRAAVLHLAFAGLGALWATTGAYDDNLASLNVTRRLGYAPDGFDVVERRGRQARILRYRLSVAEWEQHERVAVEVTGIDACRPLLGAD